MPRPIETAADRRLDALEASVAAILVAVTGGGAEAVVAAASKTQPKTVAGRQQKATVVAARRQREGSKFWVISRGPGKKPFTISTGALKSVIDGSYRGALPITFKGDVFTAGGWANISFTADI